MSTVRLQGRCDLPTDYEFARNYVAGRWIFPAAPYEYEIRSPSDSTVSTTVPLSSRFDVARAVTAAATAVRQEWSIPAHRSALLQRLVNELRRLAPDFANLQALETGLSGSDSLEAVLQGLRLSDAILRTAESADHDGWVSGATGHVLSWGLPFLEVVASCMPQLAAGNSVVVKPSLLAPMSATAFAFVADQVGLPAGVVNVVQGTGLDVGAALVSSRELVSTHVRASARVREAARRGALVTAAVCYDVGAGANVAVVGAAADVEAVAATTVDALRLHSAGGPLGLPLVLVHEQLRDELMEAIVSRVGPVVPAPLPSSAHRERARTRLERLTLRGGALAFSAGVPDDVAHRMGWRLPPAVVLLPHVTASSLARGEEPVGPIVEIATWSSLEDLAPAFSPAVRRDGIVSFWGMDPVIRDGAVAQNMGPLAALRAGVLPVSWGPIGGVRR